VKNQVQRDPQITSQQITTLSIKNSNNSVCWLLVLCVFVIIVSRFMRMSFTKFIKNSITVHSSYLYLYMLQFPRLIRTLLPSNKPILRSMGRAALVRAATKARTDGAKSKNNNRFAMRIIMAVKQGGPDPSQNSLLASIVQDARDAAVPKDVIARNIEKGLSNTTANYKESLFEFYGHGGVGLLVNVLTDNDNRAAKEIFATASRNNLKPATSGSVSFNFMKKV